MNAEEHQNHEQMPEDAEIASPGQLADHGEKPLNFDVSSVGRDSRKHQMISFDFKFLDAKFIGSPGRSRLTMTQEDKQCLDS